MTKNEAREELTKVEKDALKYYEELASKNSLLGYSKESVEAVKLSYTRCIVSRINSLSEDLDSIFCNMYTMEDAINNLKEFATDKEFIDSVARRDVYEKRRNN